MTWEEKKKRIRFVVAAIGEIPVGGSKVFPYGVTGGIAYNDAGTVKAYMNSCTHAGGKLSLQRGIFECSRHFAEFDPATGARMSGQAPEGSRLTPLEVVEEDGKLVVYMELNSEF